VAPGQMKESGLLQLLSQGEGASPTLLEQKQRAMANEQALEAGLINAGSQGLLMWVYGTDLHRKPLKAEK